MSIIKAKSAGYCFGVNKAVETAYEASKNKNEKVYTLGPLIHNAFVTNELKEKGEVMVLRPSRLIEVSRLEKDPEKLKALYQLGREDAMKNLDQIHAFLSK